MKRFFFRSPRHLACSLLLCLISFSGFSQQPFFQTQQTRATQLNRAQAEVFERAWNPKVHAAYQFVDIGPIGDVMRNRTIQLDLGNECGPVTLQVKTIEVTDQDNYYVYAEYTNYRARSKCKHASLMLRNENGDQFGLLKMGEDDFQIEALGQGQTALLQISRQTANQAWTCDAPSVQADEPLHDHGHGHLPDETPRIQENHADNATHNSRMRGCNVKVLFLFTPSAQSRIGNINNHAQAHIDQANQTLANSGITTNQLRFSKAAAVLFLDVNETNKLMSTVLTDVRFSYNGPLLRDTYHADLVCLVADDQIASFGTVLGRAYTGLDENPAPNSAGYSVINVTNNLGNQVFTHEVGHNMGGNHEDNGPLVRNRAHDFTWSTGILWWAQTHRGQTAIWSSANNSDALLYYSNPDVDHEGQATGTSVRNNALVIRTNACTVANYRNAPPSVNAQLMGPANACLDETPCFSATVSGGTPPLSYAWEWSTNATGFTYFGSGTNACLSMAGFSNGQTITIRLTVYSQGQAYQFSRSLIAGAGPSSPCFGKTAAFEEVDFLEDGGAENSMALAPNPANQRAEALLYLTDQAEVSIGIYNLTGQLVQEVLEGRLESGNHKIEVATSDIPAGMYLLKVEAESVNLVQRLVIRH